MDVEEFDGIHDREAKLREEENREAVRDAEVIRSFLNQESEGWQTIQKIYKRHLDWLLRRCFDFTRMSDNHIERSAEIMSYMACYLEVKYLIELPERTLKKGESALKKLVALKKDEETKTAAQAEKTDPVMQR